MDREIKLMLASATARWSETTTVTLPVISAQAGLARTAELLQQRIDLRKGASNASK